MSLKIEFVERAQKGETISALCREFGISRTAGNKWVKRSRDGGHEGLEEASKRPRNAPLATAEELVLAVLECGLVACAGSRGLVDRKESQESHAVGRHRLQFIHSFPSGTRRA